MRVSSDAWSLNSRTRQDPLQDKFNCSIGWQTPTQCRPQYERTANENPNWMVNVVRKKSWKRAALLLTRVLASPLGRNTSASRLAFRGHLGIRWVIPVWAALGAFETLFCGNLIFRLHRMRLLLTNLDRSPHDYLPPCPGILRALSKTNSWLASVTTTHVV